MHHDCGITTNTCLLHVWRHPHTHRVQSTAARRKAHCFGTPPGTSNINGLPDRNRVHRCYIQTIAGPCTCARSPGGMCPKLVCLRIQQAIFQRVALERPLQVFSKVVARLLACWLLRSAKHAACCGVQLLILHTVTGPIVDVQRARTHSWHSRPVRDGIESLVSQSDCNLHG